MAKITFSIRRGRVLIHKSTLRELGWPSFVRFLVNRRDRKVAVQACEAIDRDSYKIGGFVVSENQCEISSCNFLRIVYQLCDWEEGLNYRLEGNTYKRNRLVEFDLYQAEVVGDCYDE